MSALPTQPAHGLLPLPSPLPFSDALPSLVESYGPGETFAPDADESPTVVSVVAEEVVSPPVAASAGGPPSWPALWWPHAGAAIHMAIATAAGAASRAVFLLFRDIPFPSL